MAAPGGGIQRDYRRNLEMVQLLLCLLFVLMASCHDSSSSSTEEDGSKAVFELDGGHNGMVLVRASDGYAVLGTDNSNALAKERPSMKVLFSYDFSISEHEVTRGEFVEYMGGDVDEANRDLPVTNVTFGDAILFANARSKSEGFDTVYTYDAITSDEQHHVLALENFSFHPEVEGYRLPTEAEWVFVASQGWDVKKSWNNENSEYRLHTVCEKKTDDAYVCDMAGNAMEWVNDWLGNFRDTTVVNYVGAPYGGSLGERVVKGGSYQNSPKNMTVYSRSDVYTVTSSTMAEYVGFRLAFGSIPDAVWMNSNGSVATSVFKSTATAAVVREKIKALNSKLVFRNEMSGNLVYLDYLNGNATFVEIFDSLDAYHPDVSPNGRHVAFCTKPEGVPGQSSLYVRDLNEEGSNLVKLDVESAAIPRWRILPSGDTVIIYVNDAGNNKDKATFASMSTWQVKFENGKFGKAEKLFDGAYHGGISSDEKLAVSGARLLRARVEGSDTVWYNGDQACNVSLAKDGSKRSLFLDFAGATGKDFVGESYGVHERVFVVDSNGQLIQSVASPQGFSFDHTEWTDVKDIAVATLADAAGAHGKIVLVDFSDSSITELVEGEDLFHPYLWSRIKSADISSIDMDSAGVYRDQTAEISEIIMSPKMRMFWDMKDSMELVMLGSSRVRRGFDPHSMTRPSLNFGYDGCELWSELYLAENYVIPHVKNLKTLVMEIAPDLQSNTPEFKNEMLFERAPGYVYDANHNFWKDSLPSIFVDVVDENVPYSQADINSCVSTGGLYSQLCLGWGLLGEVNRDSVYSEAELKEYDAVFKEFEDFIERTKDSGFLVVGIVFPQSPLYAETGSFGRHGPPRSIAQKTLVHLDSLAAKYPHFVMMDEYHYGAHDYTDEMALDFDHLCVTGAQKLSLRLDSLLNELQR